MNTEQFPDMPTMDRAEVCEACFRYIQEHPGIIAKTGLLREDGKWCFQFKAGSEWFKREAVHR